MYLSPRTFFTAAWLVIGILLTSAIPLQAQTYLFSDTAITAKLPNKTLIPGTGFPDSSPSVATADVSTDPGADARAIACWNVVPYQDVTTDLNIGVVAFHINGIDRVEFSLNGGPTMVVRTPVYNGATKTVEYWAVLRPSLCADGPVEVRATVYPTVGLPRALDSLFLNTNANGTLTTWSVYVSPTGDDDTGKGTVLRPYQTIGHAVGMMTNKYGSLDGGTVYLAEGKYEYRNEYIGTTTKPNTGDRWVTVRSAPDATPGRVCITSGINPGLCNSKVCFRGLSIVAPDTDSIIYASYGASLWFDGVGYVGPGPGTPHMVTVTSSRDIYWTNSSIQRVQVAFRYVALVRGCRAMTVGEDAFKFVNTVINCTVNGITFAQPTFHPDVWQGYGSVDAPLENQIIYGLNAINLNAQGIGPSNVRNMAIVNATIDNTNLVTYQPMQNLQLSGVLDHVYIKGGTFTGKNMFRYDSTNYAPHNAVVEGTTFLPALTDTMVQNSGFIFR